jgi:UDP-N-acetylglucosamine 2-epimerase (non-hydrolysing)
MKQFRIHLIAAARPNFMKVSPVYHMLARQEWCKPVLVHTGQHYDHSMSDTFLRELGLPDPDLHLGVGSGTHAEQTAGVMVAYEKVCLEKSPDWVVVVGDVNSTMACTLAAKKLCIPVAHLEAGLRSGDRTMPEEINRIVTDSLADLLWTPSPDAEENLKREGIPSHKIECVGNIMMDSYELLRDRIESMQVASDFGLEPRSYGVITLHRPANVDDERVLSQITASLIRVSEQLPLVFPVHPRTSKRLQMFGLQKNLETQAGVILTDSMGYISFLSLVRDARLVITDSGGIQEETTYLNIPCLTLRDNTERPITVLVGTNRLVHPENVLEHVRSILKGHWQEGVCPQLWDGKTAKRVVASLKKQLQVLNPRVKRVYR